MKTAVEWLEEKLDDALSDTDYLTWKLVCEDIKQAKEMEKQQSDEFAVGFAEWKVGLLTKQVDGKFYFDYNAKWLTTTELLEIYKQGL